MGAPWIRKTMSRRSSLVDGSIQCASSTASSTGARFAAEEGAIGDRPHGQFLALKSGKIGQFGGVAQIERQELVIDRPHVGHGFPISREQAVELFGARRRIVIRSKANQPIDSAAGSTDKAPKSYDRASIAGEWTRAAHPACA